MKSNENCFSLLTPDDRVKNVSRYDQMIPTRSKGTGPRGKL